MANQEQSKNRGYYDFQQPMSKTQPAKASDPACGDMSGKKNTPHRDFNEGEHDFNYAAKVKGMGGNYQEFGKPQAGLNFNSAEKDASLEYLKERNRKGQEVKNYSGGNYNSRLHTMNGGVTAYNSMPINEVYTPATSHKVPPAEAITHGKIIKPESQAAANQEDISYKKKKPHA
jgi:hypothetical protein